MDFVLEALQEGGEPIEVNPRQFENKLAEGGSQLVNKIALNWGLGSWISGRADDKASSIFGAGFSKRQIVTSKEDLGVRKGKNA
eukprot:2472167-Amphidinium_carterae.1